MLLAIQLRIGWKIRIGWEFETTNMTWDEKTRTGPVLHEFICKRRQPGEQLYGVVDAARNRQLAKAAWASFELERWSLFGKNVSTQMTDVSPYLVTFNHRYQYPYKASGYLDLWAEQLGNSCGILLLSDAHPRTLWEHLSQLFRVSDEDGSRFFFRFYDPRVLRVFLPTCTEKQTLDFFGPIRCLFMESEKSNQILECNFDRTGIRIAATDL